MERQIAAEDRQGRLAMRFVAMLFAAVLIVAAAEPLILAAQAQGMTRAQRLRMEEQRLKQLLAEPQSEETRRRLETWLLRLQAEMIQPDAPRDVVVVRDTCNLPDGSIYRAGESASYAGQRYRCADTRSEERRVGE